MEIALSPLSHPFIHYYYFLLAGAIPNKHLESSDYSITITNYYYSHFSMMNHTKILVSLAVATATFAAVLLKLQSNNGGATSLLFLRGGTTANNAPPRQLQSLIATSTFQDPHTI